MVIVAKYLNQNQNQNQVISYPLDNLSFDFKYYTKRPIDVYNFLRMKSWSEIIQSVDLLEQYFLERYSTKYFFESGTDLEFGHKFVEFTIELNVNVPTLQYIINSHYRYNEMHAFPCISHKKIRYTIDEQIEITDYDQDLNKVCTSGIHYHTDIKDIFQWFV